MTISDADIVGLLKARGLSATRHRRAVARVLDSASQPMGAKEIFASMVQSDAKTSLATVYRVLAVLEKAGMVQKRPDMAGNSAQYQVPGSSKGQVVCSKCGKVELIEVMPEMEKLSKAVSKNSRFATTEQSLYIIADCRNQQCNC